MVGTEIVFLQFDGFQKDAIQMVKPAKGTTTLAFIFKDGVMVAADSRASMGGYICMSLLSCLIHSVEDIISLLRLPLRLDSSG